MVEFLHLFFEKKSSATGPFKGNHNADAAHDEIEFDIPAIKGITSPPDSTPSFHGKMF